MRYAFVKLKNPVNDDFLFMEAAEYDRYSGYDRFKDNAVSLCIYDNIHIGLFPLMFYEKGITYWNPEAIRSVEFPLSDICFLHNSTSHIGFEFGCDNCK